MAEFIKLAIAVGGLIALGFLYGRVGAVAFVLGLYFTGYASLQFHLRHYFHLTFFMLLLVLVIGVGVARLWKERPSGETAVVATRRAIACAAVAALLIWMPLFVLRSVQAAQISGVLRTAGSVELEALAHSVIEDDESFLCTLDAEIESPRLPVEPQAWEVQTEYVVAEFAPGDRDRVVRIEYEAETDFNDFSHDVTVPASDTKVRYFFPVYQSLYHSVAGEPNPSPGFDGRWGRSVFEGLRLRGEDAGALLGMYRVTDLEPFPLLYNFAVSEGDGEFEYHQTIRMWSAP